jgi:hypothetical protein
MNHLLSPNSYLFSWLKIKNEQDIYIPATNVCNERLPNPELTLYFN